MVMYDLYESRYGIFNHLSGNKKRPLASVAMHSSEDINLDSLLEEAIRTYVKRDIKEIYHLSLVEFLDLPIDVIQVMLDIATEHTREKTNAISDVEKSLKNS